MNRYKTLNTGARIPIIGLGTWELEGKDVQEALPAALEIGYRHIDTADKYYNHKDIGNVLKTISLQREDLFITSKIWRDEFGKDKVPVACQRALQELGLDYLDLYLLHWPNKDIPIAETLDAMQKLKEQGLVKAIGVANFTIHHLEDIKKTGISISMNQVEFHPSLYQKELKEYCDANNILLTAYSPLGRGKDLALPLVQDLAKKYEKSASQVILNWIMKKDIIVIPKATQPAHLKSNFEAGNWELSKEDSAALDTLHLNNRVVTPDFAEFDY